MHMTCMLVPRARSYCSSATCLHGEDHDTGMKLTLKPFVGILTIYSDILACSLVAILNSLDSGCCMFLSFVSSC